MGTLLLQCLYAFLACVGFSLVFDVKRLRFVVLSSLIGAVGWAVFLLLTNAVSSDVWRYLLATIAVSALSELSARLFKAPATVFLLIGIVPLVPGSGLYYAMSYLIRGDYELFAEKGLQTAAYAGAIAVGVSVVTSLSRMISWHFLPQHLRERPRAH